MVYCTACAKNTQGHRDSDGFLYCSECGKVLTFENFSTEATFVKNSARQSQLAGRLVRSIEDENFSRDRLYDRAACEDLMMMKDDCLGMEENMALVDQVVTSLYISMANEMGSKCPCVELLITMVYCPACAENTQGLRDSDGFLSCSECGKVLSNENSSTDATFVKNSAGQSQLAAGRLVRRSIEDDRAAREDLMMMKKDDCLGMEENMASVDQAMTSLDISPWQTTGVQNVERRT